MSAVPLKLATSACSPETPIIRNVVEIPTPFHQTNKLQAVLASVDQHVSLSTVGQSSARPSAVTRAASNNAVQQHLTEANQAVTQPFAYQDKE